MFRTNFTYVTGSLCTQEFCGIICSWVIQSTNVSLYGERILFLNNTQTDASVTKTNPKWQVRKWHCVEQCSPYTSCILSIVCRWNTNMEHRWNGDWGNLIKLGDIHTYPPQIPHGLTWKQIWAYVVRRQVLQRPYQLSFHYWSMFTFILLALTACNPDTVGVTK